MRIASYFQSFSVRTWVSRSPEADGYSLVLTIFLYRFNSVCEFGRVCFVSCRKMSIIIRMSLRSSCALGVHLDDRWMVLNVERGQYIGDSGIVAVGWYCFVEFAAQ